MFKTAKAVVDNRQNEQTRILDQDRKVVRRITREDIALRAYQIWQERGQDHGHDVEDWLQAEDELSSFHAF